MRDLFQETPQAIKAVSLWQPFASFVAAGVKPDETRHWPTAYRGLLAIHAAKTLDRAAPTERLALSALGLNWVEDVPLGAFVAVAEIYDCVPASSVIDMITRANVTAGNFAHGRFAWRLRNIRAFKRPIPARGRQGLFNWTPPADLDDLLGPVLDHAAICHRIGWAA